MPERLRQFVAWTTLAQVALVGGLGTGLHGLLGCEHGRCSTCCVGATCCAETETTSSGCKDCVFCEHAATKQRDAATRLAKNDAVVEAADCDDCALCDLLAQYHGAAPLALDPPAMELAAGEAALHRQNAVVAAAIRLAHSRGPPTA